MKKLSQVPPFSTLAHLFRDPQGFVREARKFLIALLAAFGVLGVALSDGKISTAEWIQIGVAFFGAFTTYQVTNDEPLSENAA